VPWYPKAIFGVVAVLVLALLLLRPLRDWAMRVDIRALIAIHLIRFVGFYFLILYSQKELPYSFAVRGGIGDIIIATFALILLFFSRSKPALIIWNAAGLLDILGVAVTAARSEIIFPGSMHQLDQFPLILLPTVAVPLIIVTHGIMLFRAIRSLPSNAPA
jgi:hypothetical protein